MLNGAVAVRSSSVSQRVDLSFDYSLGHRTRPWTRAHSMTINQQARAARDGYGTAVRPLGRRCGFHDMIGSRRIARRLRMNSDEVWRDERTGRVRGFRSLEHRANFMAARARISDGPNRLMPRCSATNRLGEPCKAAQDARPVNLLPPQRWLRSNAPGWQLRTFWRLGPHPARRDAITNATGCAVSGAAIRASPAGRSCWTPPMRRPAEHGQLGREFSLMYSTAIFLRSQMHAAGYGRGCRAV